MMTATDQLTMRTPAPSPRQSKATAIVLMAFVGVALFCRQPVEAAPQWEAITLADQGTFYIDPSSILREGSIRKFHGALDHKTIQSTSDGKPVLKEGILREWQPITPTSAMEKLARRVC